VAGVYGVLSVVTARFESGKSSIVARRVPWPTVQKVPKALGWFIDGFKMVLRSSSCMSCAVFKYVASEWLIESL
jgi:hypothetical protein